jgi:hypothetical protein
MVQRSGRHGRTSFRTAARTAQRPRGQADRTDAGKTAAAIEVMKVAVAARRSAELYWVARNMVEAAVGASSTLPGCYVTGLAKRQSLSVA